MNDTDRKVSIFGGFALLLMLLSLLGAILQLDFSKVSSRSVSILALFLGISLSLGFVEYQVRGCELAHIAGEDTSLCISK